MFFNSRNKNHCSSETFLEDNEPVGNTDKYVYLGVTMDRYLTFEPFLKSIIQKVNYKLYLFSMIRYTLPFNANVLVYKQMVLPFFDYLDILIDSDQKHYIEKLQCLQYRGIMIIFRYHVDGRRITTGDEIRLHNDLDLKFLDKRRIRHILLPGLLLPGLLPPTILKK